MAPRPQGPYDPKDHMRLSFPLPATSRPVLAGARRRGRYGRVGAGRHGADPGAQPGTGRPVARPLEPLAGPAGLGHAHRGRHQPAARRPRRWRRPPDAAAAEIVGQLNAYRQSVDAEGRQAGRKPGDAPSEEARNATLLADLFSALRQDLPLAAPTPHPTRRASISIAAASMRWQDRSSPMSGRRRRRRSPPCADLRWTMTLLGVAIPILVACSAAALGGWMMLASMGCGRLRDTRGGSEASGARARGLAGPGRRLCRATRSSPAPSTTWTNRSLPSARRCQRPTAASRLRSPSARGKSRPAARSWPRSIVPAACSIPISATSCAPR